MRTTTWIYPALLIIGVAAAACRGGGDSASSEAPPTAERSPQSSSNDVVIHVFDGQHGGYKQLFERAQEQAQQRDGWTLIVAGQTPRTLTAAELREAKLRGTLAGIPVAELAMIDSAEEGLVVSLFGAHRRSYTSTGVVVARASRGYQALGVPDSIVTVAAHHPDGVRSSLLGKVRKVSRLDSWLQRWSS